jgi:SpoVK/Ycf46/Vps4 family AAA+-type ATPase
LTGSREGETLTAALSKQLDSIAAGQIFVIVTTSEISSVPPALLSFGRLRKDLAFPIPSDNFRISILRNKTKDWKKKPSDGTLKDVAGKVETLSLEELTQLCHGAHLAAFQRQVPSVCNATTLKLDSEALDALEVLTEDWNTSLKYFKNAQGQISTDKASSDPDQILLDSLKFM